MGKNKIRINSDELTKIISESIDASFNDALRMRFIEWVYGQGSRTSAMQNIWGYYDASMHGNDDDAQWYLDEIIREYANYLGVEESEIDTEPIIKAINEWGYYNYHEEESGYGDIEECGNGCRVKMNESELRKVIGKCITEALDELGNTPEGRAALSRAVTKANSLGRQGQANTFMNGLRSAVSDQYGEGATNSYFDYMSDRRKVRLFFDGRVMTSEKDGSNRGQENLEDFINYKWDELRTKDRGLARRISKWCAEYLDKKLPCYQQCLDWHTWATQ